MREVLTALIARLTARFGAEVLSASALTHGRREVVARQLERLRALRPDTIVEIGTRFGCFAAVLGRIAEQVFTLDLHGNDKVPLVLEEAGVGNVVPLRVANDAAKAAVLDCLDFDLAFLDGDHSREGVALDFAHTRRCGVVLFHDYADPGFHGVTDLVDSLAEGAVVRDAPFAWWFAPGLEALAGAPRRQPSWRDGTPFCTPGLCRR